MFKKVLKNFLEKAECKKLAKEFQEIADLRRRMNEQVTKEYIANEYIKYCALKGLLINNVKENVEYAFRKGIENGSIDEYTLLTNDLMELYED